MDTREQTETSIALTIYLAETFLQTNSQSEPLGTIRDDGVVSGSPQLEPRDALLFLFNRKLFLYFMEKKNLVFTEFLFSCINSRHS